ncbi:DUF1289 domain-containing protein [Comamonas terrigena]|uniref:DUF1289 domain-containing protein n=1 Tax=Comamonas terrigena TaxID=32013 RepID=UPI0028A04E04|nr:DUF1289 domain-containing protein [Comamonas terrigena]
MSCPLPPDALLDKARTVLGQGLLDGHAVEAPPSPCISVCRMDDDRSHCVGCLRTLDELRQWGKSDAATQRQIWGAVLQRCGMAQPTL